MPSLPHYYEFHEKEYVKRLAAGKVGWDGGEYDDFFMRPFVARSLDRTPLRGQGSRVLDLGCGTGALSCQLAEAGFHVTGVDISPSAIAFARAMAAKRKLQIRFEVDDVFHYLTSSDKSDLIVDGHLLHCIVFEDERRQLLEQIRGSLKVGGEFWVEAMLLGDGMEPNPAWNLDHRGVVWTKVRDADRCLEAVWRDGNWWLPQRLIAPSREGLLAEFHAAGLQVIEHECYAPAEPGAPGGLRARCRAMDGS